MQSSPAVLLDVALDCSASGGTGIVAVVGPPGGGKSHSVLQYLAQREASRHAAGTRGVMKQCYVPMKIMTAAMRCRLLPAIAPFVLPMLFGAPGGALWKRSGDASMLSFAQCMHHYFKHQPEGSEIHIVLDDMDMEGTDVQAVADMLRACYPLPTGRELLIWVLSRGPIPLPECTRYHFISRPDANVVLGHWLQDACARCGIVSRDGSTNALSTVENESVALLHRSIEHYMTHKPMQTSVVASDARMLLHSVSRILPVLQSTQAGKKAAVNELDLSRAWKQLSGQHEATATTEGVLVDGVRGIGLSAVLLCVAVFYCGAVSPSKDRSVFGEEWDRRPGSTTAHTSAVLTSSVHLISRRRLLAVYRTMMPMCQHACEQRGGDVLVHPPVAAHHLRCLLEWNIVTPAGGRSDTYRSTLSVAAATLFAGDLGIKLMDLIPTR